MIVTVINFLPRRPIDVDSVKIQKLATDLGGNVIPPQRQSEQGRVARPMEPRWRNFKSSSFTSFLQCTVIIPISGLPASYVLNAVSIHSPSIPFRMAGDGARDLNPRPASNDLRGKGPSFEFHGPVGFLAVEVDAIAEAQTAPSAAHATGRVKRNSFPDARSFCWTLLMSSRRAEAFPKFHR